MNIKASPGIAIISTIKETKESSIIGPDKTRGRITKGKIVSMGADDMTNNGAVIPAKNYGKVGDVVYFLHYYDEGGVDVGEIGGETYFFVKWPDFRGIEK